MAKRHLAAFGVAAGLLAGGAPAALADCLVLDKELRASVSRGRIENFVALHRRIIGDPTCDGDYRARAGRLMALASLKVFSRRSGSVLTAIDDYERAASFGNPWQLMQALGDIYYARKSYALAVWAYETALDDIRDVSANPRPPPRKVEVRIAKLAYQARALAPSYVVTRTWRGRPSGLASPRFRNFTALSVPVPIRFEFNRSVLTPDGNEAAKDIMRYLTDQGSPDVRLVGHTDPAGSAAFNLALSKSRAGAVARYLEANGYTGKIEISGAGKSQPFQPDDSTRYTAEERHAFDRRVEYQLPGAN